MTTNNKQTVISLEIIELLEKELPSWFTRRMAVDKLNGIFSYSTLTNYEYRKVGPPVHYMGGRACYVKESFIDWLKTYLGGMHVEFDGFSRRIRRNKSTEVATGEGS